MLLETRLALVGRISNLSTPHRHGHHAALGLLALASAVGCIPPPPGPGGSLDDAARTTILTKLGDDLQTVAPPTDNPADLTAAILAIVQANPDFVASGVSDTGAVWARFADGRSIVIGANRFPDLLPSGAAKPRILPARDVPGSDQARCVNAFDSRWIAMTEAVRARLGESAYDTGSQGTTFSIDDWKSFANLGVLYVDGHGATFEESPGVECFVLMTSTVQTPALDAALAADLADGSLVVVRHVEGANTDGSLILSPWQYGITHKFITKYVSFARNSLAFVNSCYSDAPGAMSFSDACFAKGADVYCGWSLAVENIDAAAAGLYLFDRMLGGSREYHYPIAGDGGADLLIAAEFPPYRPFSVRANNFFGSRPANYATGAGMTNYSQSIVSDPLTGLLVASNLRVRWTSASGLAVLNPSIEFVEIDEKFDRLRIYPGIHGGLDGSDPGAGQRQILVDGVDLSGQVETWTDDEIVVGNFPRSGAGSAGKVEVIIRGHRSNPRWITAFNNCQFIWEEMNTGSLQFRLEWSLRIRGDIGRYREQQGFLPQHRESFFTNAVGASGSFNYTASGLYHDTNDTQPTNDDCETTWMSNNVMPAIEAHGILGDDNCSENSFCADVRFTGNPLRINPHPLVFMLDAIQAAQDCDLTDNVPPSSFPITIGAGGNQIFSLTEESPGGELVNFPSGWSTRTEMLSFPTEADDGMLIYTVMAPGSVEGVPDKNAQQ